MGPTLIVQLDGCDPAYLAAAPTPTLERMAAEGFGKLARGVIPSVTNVNNVSIVTGAYPDEHGISSNYWWDPQTREGVYMESSDWVCAPTLFERLPNRDSLALVVKEKLLRLVGGGADRALTAEKPPADLLDACGPPAGIYSAEINYWILDACRVLLERSAPSLIYVATSDWVFHTYAPEAEQAQEYVSNLDTRLGRLLETCPNLELYVTADHGMNAKRRALNPALTLRKQGIPATLVPIIKDRYVQHHQNLGGSAYLYLDQPDDLVAAAEAVRALPGVEEALPREVAAARFRLPTGRIGDLMLLADVQTVFGELPLAEQPVELRSHGSLYEQSVPIYAYNARVPADQIGCHLDVVRKLVEYEGVSHELGCPV